MSKPTNFNLVADYRTDEVILYSPLLLEAYRTPCWL